MTTIGVVLTALGTAVGVTGLVLPLLSDDGSGAEAEVANVRLRPLITVGGIGLEGSF